MQRHDFHHDGLGLSYLDTGQDAPVLIALHGHFMEAATFTPLAAELAPAWRVVALDQRGHGHSDHAKSYQRRDYLGDLLALFSHLGVQTAALLGHSLGGVNAYQFAARHPQRVRALIVEDIGAVVKDDMAFVNAWAGCFDTREALAERIGPRLLPYVEASIRHTDDGWRVAFDPADMQRSQAELNGDHWNDWLATDCPALLVRGSESRISNAQMMQEMASRRPHTQLATLRAGHVVHADDAAGFTQLVREFLRNLTPAA